MRKEQGKYLKKLKHNRMLFKQAWEKCDAWLEAGKKHTCDDRNRYKNHIKPRYADTSLSDINKFELEKFKTELLTKGYAPQTVKHILVLQRQIYNKMIRLDLWFGKNPVTGLEMPKINNQRARFLTHK